MEKKLHYGWIVIFMGLITTVAAHGFGANGLYASPAGHEGWA